MFGMGFMEIFLVLIVAVIALGPEKLPGAAVDIARFFKKIKGGIDEAKSTLDSELNISEMKNEANKFKSSIDEIKGIADVDLDDLTSIEEPKPKKQKVQASIDEEKPKEKKVSKKEKISLTETLKEA